MAATSNAFNNTNQNQFGNLNFTDWSQVGDMFGTEVVNALQQNNVPLDQVGSTIGKLGIAQQVQGGQGGQFGTGNPQFISSGFTLADAINMQQGGGGQSMQQGPNWDPTQNPNYDTSLLGAQALRAVGLNPSNTATINASPSNTPSSSQFQKSGVSSVANPEQVSIAGTTNPSTPLGSVFNAVQANRPTKGQTVTPTPQATGATFQPGQAFASPPPVQSLPVSGILPMAPAAPTGTPGANYANTATGVIQGTGPQLNHPFAVPSSGASNAGVALAVPKQMARGGPVGGTDTVPAMLTPGEYVINRDAAQRIGVGRLNQLNAHGPVHMQDGGEVGDFAAAMPVDDAIIDPAFTNLAGPMPVSQSAAVQQYPLTQFSQYPMAAPEAPNATNAATVNQPVQQRAPLQAAVSSGQQFMPQAANQVGPPTPYPNAATGVNMNPVAAPYQTAGQVGPPTPASNAQTGVNTNPVSTFAKQASDAAINKVAAQNPNLQRLRELQQLIARGSQAAQQSLGQRQPYRMLQNEVPSPAAFSQNNQEQLNAPRYT